MQAPPKYSLANKLAFAGIIVALLAILVGLLTPEIRGRLGLTPSPSSEETGSSQAQEGAGLPTSHAPVQLTLLNPEDPSGGQYLLRPRGEYGPQEGIDPKALQSHNAAFNTIHVQLENVGVTRAEVNVYANRPNGKWIGALTPFVTTQSDMSLVLDVSSRYEWVYVEFKDLENGSAEIQFIDFTDETFFESDPSPISAPLAVGGVTGRACDKQGAMVSIRASHYEYAEPLTVIIPRSVAHTDADVQMTYAGVVDDRGNGYFPVVVKSSACTGKPISGIRVFAKSEHASLTIRRIPN